MFSIVYKMRFEFLLEMKKIKENKNCNDTNISKMNCVKFYVIA